MLIIFSITVLSRSSGGVHRKNFQLLQTYQNGFDSQILANILFFIPIGIMIAFIHLRWLWIGVLFPIVIETMQLLLKRGMFDVDDILGNIVGLLVGAAVALLFMKMIQSLRKLV